MQANRMVPRLTSFLYRNDVFILQEAKKMVKEIKHDLGWFKLFDCSHNTYAIIENYKNTTSTSYLICGDNQSILLDTGCGIGRMKKLIFSLTSTVPTVLNSHASAYHSSANKKFRLVHILNEENGINFLTHDYSDEWISSQEKLTEDDNTFLPALFTTMSNGKKYALGEKTLEVVANDKTKVNGCMLADRTNKILFCGDIFDEECIAALDEETKKVYAQGCKEIIEEFKDYTWFFSTGELSNEAKKQTLIKKYA